MYVASDKVRSRQLLHQFQLEITSVMRFCSLVGNGRRFGVRSPGFVNRIDKARKHNSQASSQFIGEQ